MSVLDRIQNNSRQGAVGDRHAAEKIGEGEIKQLKTKREDLRDAVESCHAKAIEIGDQLEEVQNQSGWADFGDWISGDDPEADALENEGRNQAKMERAQQQQEIVAEQQKVELEKITEANQRMQATAQAMTQMLRTIDQQRRTRTA